MAYAKDNSKWIAVNAATWCAAKVLFLGIRLWGIRAAGFPGVEDMHLGLLFVVVVFTGLFDGLAFGIIDAEFDKAFKRLSFLKRVFLKTLINVGMGLLMTIILTPLLLGWNPIQGMTRVAMVLTGVNLVIMITYIFLITLLLQFGKIASVWLHAQDLVQMLQPETDAMEEERIFMFLDMRSSTSHAEKLGPVKYSAMIQDCFEDMISASEISKGEIYQFVGDEAIFTWKTSTENFQRCIRHYFDFRDMLRQRSGYYRLRYGVVPEFKAGIHHGKVIRTHVGVIRKSIAFHGDAINTASRIQGKCNPLGRDLLISSAIKEHLIGDYFTTAEGRYQLRGKDDFVNLFSIAGPDDGSRLQISDPAIGRSLTIRSKRIKMPRFRIWPNFL